MNIKAIYPGTFDPITFGHQDLVKRASNIFESVIVAVAYKTQKNTLFSFEDRFDMCREVLKKYKNVKVIKLDKLTVDHANELGTKVMLRGLRAVSDFESELQMAQTNLAISGVHTLFLPTASRRSFLASGLIREVARLGGNVEDMVPEPVYRRLKEKLPS